MALALICGCAVLGAALGPATPPLVARFSTADRPGRPPAARLAALAGGLAFGTLAAALGADPALPAFLAVAAIGVPLAFVDLACLRLPDPLVGAALLAAVVGLVPVSAGAGGPAALLRAAAAGAACAALHAALALLPGSRLGFGDVKLAGALGVPLGWLGWDAVLLGVVLPQVIGGVVALVLLLARRVDRRTALPLGPALLGGALLAVVLA